MRSRSPATSPTRAPTDLADAAARVPDERLLVETDAPYLDAAVRAQAAATSPRAWCTRRRSSPQLRGVERRPSSRRRLERNAAALFGMSWMEHGRLDGPCSRACGGCAQFDVRPDRELGQNFLVDSNILGVIDARRRARAAGRRARDRRRPRRALRVPRRARRATCTWSRSTSACARRCATRLEPHRERDAAHGRRDGARSRRRCARRRTRSSRTCRTAIAASVMLRTIEELPGVHALGRDGAARGRRAARRRAGRPQPTACRACSRSSPARCGCCARSRARCSTRCRTSTRCSSGMRTRLRAGADVRRRCARCVPGAFAHRRKTLAGSLRWLARMSSPAATPLPQREREQVREALVALGHPPDARAERLAPEDFRALSAVG